MSNGNGAPSPTPKWALDQLKEWKELISVIAAVLVSVLGGIFGESQVKTVSWGLAIIIVGVGTFWIRRSWRQKIRNANREKLWAERQAQLRQSAFRSLAPFEERDDLPGHDRKQQGRSIGTRIASDDFRFGIVCGNSGCGKTSLLRSEIARTLKAAGLEVIYVRNPSRLNKLLARGTPHERMVAALKSLEEEYVPKDPCVLILDQFEELFLENREQELRFLAGSFIRQLTNRNPPVRVVAAVRQEFLVDFHDLAKELPDPTSPSTTFKIRNLATPQAIDVINECAAADGLSPDEKFAETIANDLAEGGEVRPPELQIVCTYLAEIGGLTTARYRSVGGTAGILAHYIKDALDSSRAPELGARLLRALCDFPARAKRKPKTIADLLSDVGSVTSATEQQRKILIVDLARHFVLARVLSIEKKGETADTFTLIHDYLVDAIQLATSSASTQTEEANQLLRYYLAEGRGTIPLRKLRLITSYADAALRHEDRARRLIRKSRIAPILSAAIMGLVALCVAGGLCLLATAGVQWKSTVLARHWAKGELGSVAGMIFPERGWVATLNFTKHVRIWDGKTGALLHTVDNPKQEDVRISPKGSYVLFSSTGFIGSTATEPSEGRVIKVSDGTEMMIPAGILYGFADNERWITYSANKTEGGGRAQYLPAIYSLTEKRLVREIVGLASPMEFPQLFLHEFSSDGEWLAVRVNIEGRPTVALYNAVSGEKLGNLGSELSPIAMSLHGLTSQVCTVVRKTPTDVIIQLWRLRDGAFLRERTISWDSDFQDIFSFSKDGSHILLWKTERFGGKGVPPIVLRTSDLESVEEVLSSSLHLASNRGSGDPVLWWNTRDGVKVWEVGSRPAVELNRLKLRVHDKLKCSESLRYAVAWGEGRPVELWNLEEGELLAVLDHSGQEISDVFFSADGTAVIVSEEDGLCSLFSAPDGSPLAKRIANGVIWYDPELRRFHLWNEAGQIVRYVEGRSYFGAFFPTRPGASK